MTTALNRRFGTDDRPHPSVPTEAHPVIDPPHPPRQARDTYCPFALETDPRRFGLTTSSMRLGSGPVSVRHGRRTGSDTAIIFLHGAAGSWTTWTPLLTAATSGEPGAYFPLGHPTGLNDLVIPDLPGWGDTSLPVDETSLTIESMAAVVAEIARALGYRRWIVVGHSMGGLIALELASAEKQATVSVGLVSATTFSVIQSVRHPLTRFGVLPGFTSLLQVMRVLRLSEPFGRALVGMIARFGLLRPVVAPLFRHVGRIDPSVISALAEEVRPAGFSIASDRAGAYDARAAWSRIECPVRASRGDRDVFVTESDDRLLTAVISDFTIKTMADTGHFGHIEHPFHALAALDLPVLKRLVLRHR